MPADIVGVVVAVPDPVDSQTGVVRQGLQARGWDALSVTRELKLRLRWDCPFRLENNANLAALAEQRWGAAQGRSNFVHVRWADRIGAGVIVGGKLFRGANGAAGEIGHTPVKLPEDHPAGVTPCPRCGRVCVEAAAGRNAIIRAARDQGCDVMTLSEVLGAAERDLAARHVLDRAAGYLGEALATTVNVLNPELITIGGDFGPAAYEYVSGGLRRGLSGAVPQALRDVSVELGHCTGRATLLGGAAFLLEHEGVPFLLDRTAGFERPGDVGSQA